MNNALPELICGPKSLFNLKKTNTYSPNIAPFTVEKWEKFIRSRRNLLDVNIFNVNTDLGVHL